MLKLKNHLIYFFFILLLPSCYLLQPPPPNNVTRVFSEKSAPQAKSQPAAPPSYEIQAPALSPRYPSAKTFSVSVYEIDAREFFLSLVADSNQNIVVHPDVKGFISLKLSNVTLPQVMEVAQKVYGYDYKRTEMGYIVYPASMQTRTFKIDRLDLMRVGRSNTYVSSGQTANGNQGQGYGMQQGGNAMQPYGLNQSGNFGGGMNTYGNQGSQTSGSSITTITPASNSSTTPSDFWKDLEDGIRALISIDKDASVIVNRQSGVVIVRAKPLQMREIEHFLNATEDQIGRQVILEAKILEIVLNDSHQDGVEWKSIIRQGLQTAPALGGDVGTVFTLASRAGSFRAGDFTAVVTLLESQGKTNVLSSPRISTLNNQQAIIKVGKDETFVTGISPGIAAGGIGAGTAIEPAPILSSFFSGIALDVTPQINDAGDITLHIHPSITDVRSQDREYSIDSNGTKSVVPTALSTIRESDSIVRAKNGQIVVLGGLMQDNYDENKEGVTGFSQIPILGNLFRVNKGARQKTELVILLKASVINQNSDWERDINATEQRSRWLDAIPRWQ
jgi:MSHA biogenesis protein MshL